MNSIGLVLGGGGARGAYQAGVLRGLGRKYPSLSFPVLTGISAGAINTAFLAAHSGTLASATDDLARLWMSITPEQVYGVDAPSLARNLLRWGWQLVSGGTSVREQTRGLVDTTPLGRLLADALPADERGAIGGIERNIARRRLRAVALSATSYSTGQSVTWVQGDGRSLWQRSQRRAEHADLGVEHVMASSALPVLFPAIRVAGEWYGDGGVRLTAPLSPALHLGADRIVTISTRRPRSLGERATVDDASYPPLAQVAGVLYNAVFLDVIDQDIARLEMINELLRHVPESQRGPLRMIDVLVIRPSLDLGRLSREFEPNLPAALRFLTRGWGTRRTPSPDVLSLLMFQRGYLRALVELGEHDVEAQSPAIDAFLGRRASSEPAA